MGEKINGFVKEFDLKIEEALKGGTNDKIESIKQRGGGQYWFDAFMFIVDKYYLKSDVLSKFVSSKKQNLSGLSDSEKLIYDMPGNGTSVASDYTDYARFYTLILSPGEANSNSGALDRMRNGYLNVLVPNFAYDGLVIDNSTPKEDPLTYVRRNEDILYLAFREAGDNYKGPKTDSVVNPVVDNPQPDATTNTQKDAAKAIAGSASSPPQESKVIDDGYEIIGDFTFNFVDAESMTVVGPDGDFVKLPDGSVVRLGVLNRTAMPVDVPIDTKPPVSYEDDKDQTGSKDAPIDDLSKNKTGNENENSKSVNKPSGDVYTVGLADPKNDKEKNVTGTITLKKRGPWASAIGKVSGLPDGGTVEWEGQESFYSEKAGLVEEMRVILQNMIQNKYNVDVKLVVKQ